MNTLEEDLKTLVKNFAPYAGKEKHASTEINNADRIRLESALTEILYKNLLQEQCDIQQIRQNYLELLPYFTKQADKPLSPDITWLEQVLSKGGNGEICLQILTDKYQHLINPEQFKNIRFADITNVSDLDQWLRLAKARAATPSKQRLYDSLLSLLAQTMNYIDDVGQLKPEGLGILVSSLPGIIITLGTLTVAEELFAIYAFYFILLKGGQLVSGIGSIKELKNLGNSMQHVSVVTASTTTTILVRLLELVFWTSHRSYTSTVQAKSSALALLRPASSAKVPTSLELFKAELHKAEASRFVGYGIQDVKLRIIAAPIEARIGELGAQTFLTHRVGATKLLILEQFLFKMRELDRKTLTIEDKLIQVKDLLTEIHNNRGVYTSETARAIDRAEAFLQFALDRPQLFGDKHCVAEEDQGAATKLLL